MSDHPFPPAALAHHVAILAKTGAGKSYLAQGLVERLLDDGQRVAVIDPTGRYWGLRSSAAGDGPGYPVVVFGGNHADAPLAQHHGEALADIIGTSSTPAILDTRLMTVGERTRFFTDFAEALLRKNKGPLTLVVDEAHLFCPQGRVSDPQSGKMLHAANNLVSLGRGVGLRIVLISQRPAKLHKDALTQVETLVVLRLIAPQDIGAVKDWIGAWADPAEGRELLASLPSLPTGTGWIWSPELGVLERATFPRIKTYDSGRAPVEGESEAGPVLAPIDLPAIEARLSAVAEEAKANDPAALRKRIAELERQLSEKGGQLDEAAIEAAWQEGYAAGLDQGALQQAAADNERIGALRRAIEAATGYLAPFIEADDGDVPVVQVRHAPAPPTIEHRPVARERRAVASGGSDGALHPAARKLLGIFAQHHPMSMSWHQACTLAGLKARGGHFNAGRKDLTERGLVDETDGVLRASASGLAEAGEVPATPQSAAETLALWVEKLPRPARDIVETLSRTGPMTWDEVAAALGIKAHGGYWNSGRRILRDNGLIVESGGTVAVVRELRQ